MTIDATLLDQFERELDERPDDWDLRRIAADAYEDAGEELRSAFLRWSAENRKYPWRRSSAEFWWWAVSSGHYPEEHQLPGGHELSDLADFWRARSDWEVPKSAASYPCQSRLLAEWALAVYLRHHGVI